MSRATTLKVSQFLARVESKPADGETRSAMAFIRQRLNDALTAYGSEPHPPEIFVERAKRRLAALPQPKN